jgi:dolichol-phosphate mannosyltransferase
MESENHTPTISVVVPLYNEEAIFSELIERLNQTLQGVRHSYEILFVDDGSTDTTAELIQKALQKDVHIRYLGLSRNFGHQAAVTAGRDYEGSYFGQGSFGGIRHFNK